MTTTSARVLDDSVADTLGNSLPVTTKRPATPRKVLAPHSRLGHSALARISGLDGLRALAVSAVVAYHAGATWLPGGFLGVDVFFVLSGFLITLLLLHEASNAGRLDIRTFYRRRVRRLVPALWVMLAVVAVAGVIMRDQLASLRWHVLAGATYLSNWWQILADDSYFESSGRPPLLRHLWSLAIEGQFYLIAPVIAWVAFRWGKRRVAWVALALAALSTATMAFLALTGDMPIPNDPSRLYFGTDTHAGGLLVGVALGALVASGGAIRWWWTPAIADFVGVAALVALAVIMTQVGEFSGVLYRGGFLVVSVLSALVILVCLHPGALVGRALDWAPLVWFGTRSYGIYLWHWPVFMVTRPGIDLAWTGWEVQFLRITLVLVLAEISYRLVERPIRRGALVRWRAAMRTAGTSGRRATGVTLAAAGLSAALIATLFLVPPTRSDVQQAADALENSTVLASVPGPRQGVELGTNAGPVARTAALAAPTTKPDRTEGDKTALDDPAAPGWAPLDPGAPEVAAPADAAPEPIAPAAPAASEPVAPAPQQDPAVVIGTVTAVGDSVLAMAIPDLAAKGFAVDAVKSRQFRAMVDIVVSQRDAGTLGNTVVVQGGTNGPIAESDLRRLFEATTDRRVYLLNMRAPVTWEALNNELLPRIAAEYPHVQIIDWYSISGEHPDWLYSDAIHPREGAGTAGLTEAIWSAIQPS